MNDTSASANLDSMFGPEPTPAAPPVAAPASTPELAPVTPPVDPFTGVPMQPQPAPVAEPPAPPEPPKPPTPTVPLPELLEQRHRYQAERAAREAAERQNQQLMETLIRLQQQPQQPQQQPQPIDPLAEPERAFQALQQKIAEQDQALRTLPQAIMQQVQEQRRLDNLEASRTRARETARAKFGSDAIVDQAIDAAGKVGLDGHFAQQPDPIGAAVSWFQTQQVAQEVGADPAAYRAKIAAEERARFIAELKQGQRPSNIPPSITSATNSASAPSVVTSSRDFFSSMANEPMRKRQ